MTFEEFFIKKNIDLPALKAANPSLFEEFHLHFTIMGEKSFDHSKKFWFNRLRKDFKLPDLVHTPSDSIPVAKPTDFKARFKAAGTKAVEQAAPVANNPEKEIAAAAPVQQAAEPETTSPKPKGFTYICSQ